MSDSSLSPLPADSEYQYDTQELPTLPPHNTRELPTLLPLRRLDSSPQLPDSNSTLFAKGLFTRTILDDTPVKIQLKCLQPNCNYMPMQPVNSQTTSNLWKHLKKVHPLVHVKHNQLPTSTSSTSSVSGFFEPRKIPRSATSVLKYRELLLSFMVSNNLPF